MNLINNNCNKSYKNLNCIIKKEKLKRIVYLLFPLLLSFNSFQLSQSTLISYKIILTSLNISVINLNKK